MTSVENGNPVVASNGHDLAERDADANPDQEGSVAVDKPSEDKTEEDATTDKDKNNGAKPSRSRRRSRSGSSSSSSSSSSEEDKDKGKRGVSSDKRERRDTANTNPTPKESQESQEKERPKSGLDREKTCPLLLRVFCSPSRHNSMQEYQRGKVPANELQIYTWMDATLKELTSLVREVNPDARRRGTFFDFALVFPNPTGNRGGARNAHFMSRDIGTTVSGQKGPDDSKSLKDCRFVIGDYMDIAITPANGRGFGGGGGGGGDRRGGGGGFGGRGGRDGGGGFGGRGGDRDDRRFRPY